MLLGLMMSEVLKMTELGVPWLLRVCWIAGILPLLIAAIPVSRLVWLHRLVLGFSRRGKMVPSSSQKFTVPQRFFLHFYVFAVVWTTTLLILTWYYAYKVAPLSPNSMHFVASHLTGGSHFFSMHKSHSTSVTDRYLVWRSVFLLLLMEIHVVRRLYETLYVFKYSRSARMHILAYLIGYYFYFAAPLSLCAQCVVQVFNFAADQVFEFYAMGPERMSLIEYDFLGYLKPITKLGWCQWVGAAIFVLGWVHQLKCHAILGSLRASKKDQDRHLVPWGDWFNYVSSPHYLAEMVIYTGLVIASGGTDLTVWLVLTFTVLNLSFAAGDIHRWYLEKFEDYPRNRKAVIPHVY